MKPHAISTARIVRLYTVDKLSAYEISAVLAEEGASLCPVGVRYRLKAAGVKLRSIRDARRARDDRMRSIAVMAPAPQAFPLPTREAPGWPTKEQLMGRR